MWRAPLFPLALLLTAGIVADRYADVPIGLSLLLAGLGLVAWAVARTGRSPGLPLVYLGLAVVGVGACVSSVESLDLSRG